MRYISYKQMLQNGEFSVIAKRDWIDIDLDAMYGSEQPEQEIRIPDRENILWAQLECFIEPMGLESHLAKDYPEESMEAGAHYLEILKGTYPGYSLGAFEVGYGYIWLYFAKEDSPFYFVASFAEADLDITFTGPATRKGCRPTYKVRLNKESGSTIEEQSDICIRVFSLHLIDSEGPAEGDNVYAVVDEYTDI